MILVIWQIVPESIRLYELPETEENIELCKLAHGSYIGADDEGASALWAVLETLPSIYNDEYASNVPVRSSKHYPLVIVTGQLL